ncbi:LOW QUALITY PROTEIN: phosphoglucan phosphatase LSF1, chloroplastic [Phoenix dactylifera]|uniref:LOW QUALITY PROTEIN: phosphoglucan phosphatase LSF1, chloroplastic n=1 Tax=Phoenix dactylifera TaxID=42345 RepID=A0A8B9A4I0_PHODC|nr:LOW QUALITY PROTEIN: phosphoglucan phosphatase LSF1, chloroplastic [Phoenix dactylifera]
MALLQLPQPTFYSSSLLERSARSAALSSSRSGDRCSPDAISRSLILGRKRSSGRKLGSVLAMADPSMYKMNLNEYMVTLEKPLGIRFALSADGKIFVHSLKRGGNAEKSRIIMVGDMLKKASNKSDGGFIDIKDLSDAEMMLKDAAGSCSLVLERPFSPYPIHQLHLNGVFYNLFNRGRVPFATWNRSLMASHLQPSREGTGNTGFAIFSPKFLASHGWMLLSSERSGSNDSQMQSNSSFLAKHTSEIIGIFSEEESKNVEWAYGSFPLEEYIKALDRAKGELYYNHSLGMQYSKITEQIFVGSSIQTEKDVQMLSNAVDQASGKVIAKGPKGITAVLNFQSESECANWGINSESINNSCSQYNILMVNYPIREVDSGDLRKKLPFCVGLLLRLLRKNFRIYVTCTTGFDRSPACVIAYLHWIQDTALHAAHNFVTGLHLCRPDRAAIVWATWDLIAMAENGKRGGPPTHAVNFVWSNGSREGDEVYLVGDFISNWKESIKAVHKGGSKYEVELRLRHGKYHYKFIVNGQWRHSAALPTETDEHGNVNNVIRVGDIARIRPALTQLQIKDPTVVKVIERPLTEDERFLLAFAARRIALSICPVKLAPK